MRLVDNALFGETKRRKSERESENDKQNKN